MTTIPPDVLKAIEELDRQAAELTNQRLADIRKRRDMLIDSFSSMNNNVAAKPERRQSRKRADTDNGAGKPALTNSATRLWMFLKSNGPSTRAEILSKSGIPVGTVSTAVNRFKKHHFRLRDNKWEVIEMNEG